MSVPAVAVVGARSEVDTSATRSPEIVAGAKLLAGLVSSVALVAATVAVLTIGPVAAGLMCTVMVMGWVVVGAVVPKVQVTASAVLLHPALRELHSFPTRRSSDLTVPPLEVEGPTLVTVRV